jgi:hypothetical protein
VADPVGDLATHVLAPRRVAALLVRRGGYACAVVDGGRVVASKVGHPVRARAYSGGRVVAATVRPTARQADRRAGRRRGRGRRPAADGATDGPAPGWLVTGGDRPLLDAVLADPRLAVLRTAPRGVHLSIGDPRSDLVGQLPDLITQVRVTLTEP